MSDQYKGALTSLEQVFFSRDFEDARDRREISFSESSSDRHAPVPLGDAG
jgi:hypothetical protein